MTMTMVECTEDGRWFIRTAAGNVARRTNGEPFYARTRAEAVAARDYLALDYTKRKLAPHWLKSAFGLE
jgi:hypothetical protein